MINDENWKVMCESLANNPALEHLNVTNTVQSTWHRTQYLVDLLKVNHVLAKIDIGVTDPQIMRAGVRPRLAIKKQNRCRERDWGHVTCAIVGSSIVCGLREQHAAIHASQGQR
jgi:hypothetical protein